MKKSLNCAVLSFSIAVAMAAQCCGQEETKIRRPGETQPPEAVAIDSSLADALFDNGTEPVEEGTVQLTKDSVYVTKKNLLLDSRYGYRVMMPGQPQGIDQTLKTNFGSILLRTHMLKTKDAVFMQLHSDYPRPFFAAQGLDPVERPDEFLEFTAQTSLHSKSGAKLLHRKKFKLGKYHGLEQAMAFPAGESNQGRPYGAGVIFQRSFVRRESLDSVIVQFSREAYQRDSEAGKKMMIRYLDSFQYTE